MWKTRIEVRADIVACADALEITRLVVNDWRDKTTNMADNDGDDEIDHTNVELVEFDIHTKIFLIDNIRKTCRKWAINNFMKCSDNNLITSLIINIGAESVTYIDKSLTICRCQVDELDRPDIDDIDHISENVVS